MLRLKLPRDYLNLAVMNNLYWSSGKGAHSPRGSSRHLLETPFSEPLLRTKEGAEKKKAYTTTTERKSFGELFWPKRKTFQASGGYKNPIKTRKTISTTEIFPLWTPFFSAKKSSALEQGGVCFLFPRRGKGYQKWVRSL